MRRGISGGRNLQSETVNRSLTYELPPVGGGTDFYIEFYNLGYEQNIAV